MASYDVIFLGGGPAGYVGAIRAAQVGLTVAVIEREGLGGTCVLWGCIPAKALLESAYLAGKMRHAADHGITTGPVTFDFGPAMKRSRAISTQNSKGVEFLFKKNKITWIKGTGTLVSPKSVSVAGGDGKQEIHEARRGIVLSTGSRVRGLPAAGLPLDQRTVLSSDDVLVLEHAPKSMLIVGAGAVGCEFADVFHSYGTQVTLIDIAPVILPLEDAEVSAELTRSFKKRKIDVITNATTRDVQISPTGATLTIEAAGAKQPLTVEKILVAAGRAPNVDNIGLDKLGVQLSDRGFVKIDEYMRTSVPGVYAIGDVAGVPMLAHKGEREGIVVAEHLAGLHPHLVNYGNIPNATYCHPEVASIGLTEAACKERKLAHKVGRFPFSASGRARTAGETEGFVKIIADATYGEILGAHIIGSHATELIHELAVARENEFTVEEVDLAIHAHPTLSEAIAEAALDTMGRSIHGA
jgi:dihydrolipoamide dehydrogenase